MKRKITKRVVDAVEAGQRDVFLWDTETRGFGLKVTPAGKRIYVVQARLNGRPVRCTIGQHGAPWTPDRARTEAIRLLGEIAAGSNPNVGSHEARTDVSVADIADLYFDEGCAHKKPGTLDIERSLADRHIKPLVGKNTVRQLDRGDVERMMRDIAAGKTAIDERTKKRGRAIVRGGQGIANRTTDLLSSILSFAVARGLRVDNPVRGINKFRMQKRERFLTTTELASLGEALRAAKQDGANIYAIAAIRLLMLTGCRKSEILTLQWNWVDIDRGCLRLPDSKTGAKVVILGQPALDLLEQIPRVEGNPHVIAGGKNAGHLVGLQKIWNEIRIAAGLPDVRLHDLRHSFASVGVGGGDSLYIVGKLLGHTQAATTQRYAHLADDPLKSAVDRISSEIARASGLGDD